MKLLFNFIVLEDLHPLLFIDLDKFKQVNDSLGHDAGDEILQQATKRMSSFLQSKDILSRLGGDEFTIIIPDLKDERESIEIAENIKNSLMDTFDLAAGKANIGCSIGISFYPKEASSTVALVKNADVAMYTAKDSGRNQCVLYRDVNKTINSAS